MAVKIVEDRKLADGRGRILASVDADELRNLVKENVGFLQALCGGSPTAALAVAQVTLDELKKLFGVVGAVKMMENRPQ